jgi:hypothetical protein
MNQLMELLFKYRWAVLAKGEFSFANRPVWPTWLTLILLLAGVVGITIWLYRVGVARSGRLGLALLRGSLLMVLLLLIMRPVVVVPAVIPRSMSLAILVDDSRSMQLNDTATGESRLAAVRRVIGQAPQADPLMAELDAKFRLRLYGFAGETRSIPRGSGWNETSLGEALKGEGQATDLAGALEEARQDAAGSELGGIILFSDGGANTTRDEAHDLASRLRELRAAGVPVYTIGVGNPDRFRDLELTRVSLPRRVLIGSAITADLHIRQSGDIETSGLTVRITEDGRPLRSLSLESGRRDWKLTSTGEPQPIAVEFSPSTPGAHRYGFELVTAQGVAAETTTENNLVEALIEVTGDSPRILHIEGEPRWEYGKLRFSLAKSEKNLTLVSVLRSADGKFYRQGVGSGSELTTGFPATPEELFSYAGLVMGSIEANFFSYEQLRMIEQFAGRRGGGVLALGGGRAFSAGKYARTPIADLLPVVIGDSAVAGSAAETAAFRPRLPQAGERDRLHPVTRLNEDRALSLRAWEEMPAVTIPEQLTQLKPGAATILEAALSGEKGRVLPLLVEQRYGRGRSVALLASDTWRWRMELPSQNTSHETFWRQLLRYLVSTTPRQYEVAAALDSYAIGDEVRIVAEVNDPKFEPVTDATAVATITRPNGERLELPLEITFDGRSSSYQGTMTATEPGTYEVRLATRQRGGVTGEATGSFLVSAQSREFFGAAQNVALLKQIATETGGRYYPLAEAGAVIDEVTMLEGRNSERVSRDLWDMPINFLLLIGLAGAEWFLRKRQGLA